MFGFHQMLILTREEYSITGPPIPKHNRVYFCWDFLRAKLLAMSALLSLTYGFAFLISVLIPKVSSASGMLHVLAFHLSYDINWHPKAKAKLYELIKTNNLLNIPLPWWINCRGFTQIGKRAMKHSCWDYCNVNTLTIYVLGPSFISSSYSTWAKCRQATHRKGKKSGSVTYGNRPVAWLEWQ